MNKKEKIKVYGEVFTPEFLVNDMLDTLPVDVWSNPKLRWLDPCNGQGAFTLQIIRRLFDGLQKFEPNKKKRFKYIVEKMIYVVEIQKYNNDIYEKNVQLLYTELTS